MPQDYVFGGRRNEIAKRIDQDLALNTRGPIRPVRESDLGDRTDAAIFKGALGGRFTTGRLPEKRFAHNRPPDNPEQVAPRRPARRLQRPATRKGGR